MKYNYFQIFKFSTISKNINRIKDSFSRIYKKIKNIPGNIADSLSYILKDIFFGIRKGTKFIIYNFLKICKLTDPRSLDFTKVYKYFNIKRYDFYRIDKRINFKKYKHVPIYFVIFVIIMGFVYLVIPKFYSYDKLKITKAVCNNQNVECLIKGKIYYSFFPSPRMIIKDLVINKKKNNLAKVENAVIKLPIKNLLVKEKHKFKKIKFNNFEIFFNLKNFKEYENIFINKINLIPINFTKGKIIFLDGKNYVATINKTNLNFKFMQNSTEAILKGKFLNDDIYFNLNSEVVDNKPITDIVLKMSDMNFLTKINFTNSEKDKNIKSGNLLIKKGKNRITTVFDYRNNELVINKSNLKNPFLDGKLEGKITFLPYLDFNLDIDLRSLNFTKLYNYLLALDEEKQKNLFKINNKINGKLSLSSDKIYSGYNLVKSMESRIKFSNGNILIEQFLINLGKLGASDLLGTINNDKNITKFRFESNIFIDNQKKFLSKFGIYNKAKLPSNFFISGNFDLENLRTSFYEISGSEKLNNDDINFIEQEFNDFMLVDGLKSLFLFPKFKQFIKSITSETN
tara:strand:- start:330 stop:2039 length:1710 start_codon:yes stop_codon:yes gene_type:complete